MTGFDVKTWLEWVSPEDRIYTGFGDASVMPTAALYGIVLVPSSSVGNLELAIEKVKVRFGGSAQASIHCREIFNPHARAKGVWAHLTDEQTILLLRDSFLAANSFGVRYFVAFSLRQHFPQKFRLLGKNGHKDLLHDIDDNWITLNLFQGLAKYFDPAKVLPPPNYRTSTRGRNEPFWQVIVKRDYPGAVVDKLYVDREQAKIRWFSKSFQWTTVAKDIVIENSTSRSFLPIVSPIEEKHSLLQLADMFIYAQGRELTGRALEFGNLMSKDVFLERVGQEGIDEIVRGMPEDVAAYWANKHSVEL